MRRAYVWAAVVAWIAVCATASDVALRSAIIKLTRARDRELVPVARYEEQGWELGEVAPEMELNEKMSMGFYFSIWSDDLGMEVFLHQLFVRFEDLETGEVFVLAAKRKSTLQVLEMSLSTLTAQNTGFWRSGAAYALDVIFGDSRMPHARVWRVCSSVRFNYLSEPPVQQKSPFLFDIGVHTALQPEFAPERDGGHPTAPVPLTVLFSVLVVAPFLGFLVILGRLGALPPQVPWKSPAAVGFQVCLVAAAAVLVRFWLGSNILDTFRLLALLAVPLVPSGYLALKEVERSLHATKEE